MCKTDQWHIKTVIIWYTSHHYVIQNDHKETQNEQRGKITKIEATRDEKKLKTGVVY